MRHCHGSCWQKQRRFTWTRSNQSHANLYFVFEGLGWFLQRFCCFLEGGVWVVWHGGNLVDSLLMLDHRLLLVLDMGKGYPAGTRVGVLRVRVRIQVFVPITIPLPLSVIPVPSRRVCHLNIMCVFYFIFIFHFHLFVYLFPSNRRDIVTITYQHRNDNCNRHDDTNMSLREDKQGTCSTSRWWKVTGRVETTRTGPNDAICIVWALGECKSFSFEFFVTN